MAGTEMLLPVWRGGMLTRMNTPPIRNVRSVVVGPFGLTAFAFGAIFLLAIGLRIWNITESLWIDELHTSWSVNGGFNEVLSRAAWGNQPPLFYWLTWIVQALLGQSEVSLRMLSLIAGLALVIGLACLTWLLTRNRWCVLMAAFIAAVDVDLVFYSQEARPYALIQWLTVLHFVAFILLVREQKQRMPMEANATEDAHRETREMSRNVRLVVRTIWVATFVAAFYSHYTALIVIVPESMLLAGISMVGISSFGGRRLLPFWKPWLLSASCALVLCVPSVVHLRAISSRGDDWAVLMQTWPLPISIARCLLLYVIPTCVLIGLAIWARRKSGKRAWLKSQNVESSPIVWLLAVSLPIAACWALARMDWLHVFLPRYLMALMPLACLIPILAFNDWCRTISSDPKRRRRTIMFGGLLMMFFIAFESPLVNAPWPAGRLAVHRGEDWRQAVRQMPEPRTEQSIVFLFPSLVEDGRLIESRDKDFQSYTAFALGGLYELPQPNDATSPMWEVRTRATMRSPRLREADVRQLVSNRNAWLIVRGNYDTLEPILNEFADQLSQVGLTFDALVDVYGSVLVVELEVLEPDELRQRQQANGSADSR